MPSPQRATIAQALGERVDAWLRTATRWADSGDFQIKVFARDAHKLHSADAVAGSELQAVVAHLTGDVTGAERSINKLQMLGHGLRAAFMASLVYSNLGRFSDALSQLRQHPRLLNESLSARKFTFVSGGYDLLTQLQPDEIGDDPVAMQLHTMATSSMHSLQAAGVSVLDAQQALQIAGDVLANHRLFFVGELPLVHALPDHLLVQLVVDAPASQLAAMNDQYLDTLIQRNLDRPGFSFAFISQA
jgi:hypothetical protein